MVDYRTPRPGLSAGRAPTGWAINTLAVLMLLSGMFLAIQYFGSDVLYENELRQRPDLNIALTHGDPGNRQAAARLFWMTIGLPVFTHLVTAIFAVVNLCRFRRSAGWVIANTIPLLILLFGIQRALYLIGNFID